MRRAGGRCHSLCCWPSGLHSPPPTPQPPATHPLRLAHEAAATLFPVEDPLGRAVQVGQEFYVVVGVAAVVVVVLLLTGRSGPLGAGAASHDGSRPAGGSVTRRVLHGA